MNNMEKKQREPLLCSEVVSLSLHTGLDGFTIGGDVDLLRHLWCEARESMEFFYLVASDTPHFQLSWKPKNFAVTKTQHIAPYNLDVILTRTRHRDAPSYGTLCFVFNPKEKGVRLDLLLFNQWATQPLLFQREWTLQADASKKTLTLKPI